MPDEVLPRGSSPVLKKLQEKLNLGKKKAKKEILKEWRIQLECQEHMRTAALDHYRGEGAEETNTNNNQQQCYGQGATMTGQDGRFCVLKSPVVSPITDRRKPLPRCKAHPDQDEQDLTAKPKDCCSCMDGRHEHPLISEEDYSSYVLLTHHHVEDKTMKRGNLPKLINTDS